MTIREAPAALLSLGLMLAITACAPRQPPGGDLWRAISTSPNER